MKFSLSFSIGIVLLILAAALSGCAEKTDTPQEFLNVAYQREREGKYLLAVEAYQSSLKLNPGQPTAWYDMGVSYAAMDKITEAIDAYSRAIELDQSSARPYNNRAAAYARMKEYDLAIADCDRAIELDPDDFLAWRNRGLAKHDKGDLEKAVTDYDESIRINGRVAETYHYRGNVFLDQKKYSRALEDFDQAVHLDERLGAAHLSRAIALARLGREADAVAARAIAQDLGSKVDDLIVASLLPTVRGVDESQAVHVAAVSFVRGELAKAGLEIDSGMGPFDLQSGDEANRTHYIIRTVLTSDQDAAVSFTAGELKEIEAHRPSATLIIVGIASNESQNEKDTDSASASTCSILQTIAQWKPDIAHMQPVAWKLLVSKAATPVASAD